MNKSKFVTLREANILAKKKISKKKMELDELWFGKRTYTK